MVREKRNEKKNIYKFWNWMEIKYTSLHECEWTSMQVKITENPRKTTELY